MNKSRLLNLVLLTGLAGSLTFGLITFNTNLTLTEKNTELTNENKKLTDENQSLTAKLNAVILADAYTIKTLEGRIENLQSLITSKNTKISDLTTSLNNVQQTAATLLYEVKLQKKMMDAYSNTLEKANTTIESLQQQITTLDESVAEFAEEIVKAREDLNKLQEQHNKALYAVFEINDINKRLNNLLKECVQTKEALLSYLRFYEKHSIVLKQGTCINQLMKNDEDSEESYPYQECDGEILVNGQKIDDLRVLVLPKNTDDKTSKGYK